MKRIQLLCLLLLLIESPVSFSQTIDLTGENYLTLNGERFKNQKIILTKADGDWFATSKDCHGAISFYGNYEGRKLRLDIEWDGKDEQHLVTNEIRHNGKRTGEFFMTMEDKAVYGDGLNAYPEEEDEIKIRITKADDLSVSGDLNGMITQSQKKVRVDGAFNLKRAGAQKRIVNSAYKDCDNVVHDKLIGAEARSPSECEAKYDLDVRTAIHDAVAPMIDKFQNDGWEVDQQTGLEPLFAIGRGSEKDICARSYELVLKVAQTSPTYASYQKRYTEMSDNLKEPSKEKMDQFMKFAREMNGALNGNIFFFTNNHSIGFGNYKGGAKISKLSSGIYVIQSTYVQARTGGGEDAAVDATFVLIGKWKQPVIEKLDDGGETIRAAPVLDPSASHLQTQNIVIRMECNAAVANSIIDNLDLKKLQAMIQ